MLYIHCKPPACVRRFAGCRLWLRQQSIYVQSGEKSMKIEKREKKPIPPRADNEKLRRQAPWRRRLISFSAPSHGMKKCAQKNDRLQLLLLLCGLGGTHIDVHITYVSMARVGSRGG